MEEEVKENNYDHFDEVEVDNDEVIDNADKEKSIQDEMENLNLKFENKNAEEENETSKLQDELIDFQLDSPNVQKTEEDNNLNINDIFGAINHDVESVILPSNEFTSKSENYKFEKISEQMREKISPLVTELNTEGNRTNINMKERRAHLSDKFKHEARCINVNNNNYTDDEENIVFPANNKKGVHTRSENYLKERKFDELNSTSKFKEKVKILQCGKESSGSPLNIFNKLNSCKKEVDSDYFFHIFKNTSTKNKHIQILAEKVCKVSNRHPNNIIEDYSNSYNGYFNSFNPMNKIKSKEIMRLAGRTNYNHIGNYNKKQEYLNCKFKMNPNFYPHENENENYLDNLRRELQFSSEMKVKQRQDYFVNIDEKLESISKKRSLENENKEIAEEDVHENDDKNIPMEEYEKIKNKNKHLQTLESNQNVNTNSG